MSEKRTSDRLAFQLPGLSGAKVLIFGGSGHIGTATTALLAQQGAATYATYFRNREKTETAVASLGKMAPANAGFCDFQDPRSIRDAFEHAQEHFGSLDGLVCAVGSRRREAHFLADFPDDYLRDIVATQFQGVAYCFRESLRYLSERASIVVVSSVVATRGYIEGSSLHAAAKAGLEGLVRHAAIELASKQIRVNAVAPGYIRLGEDEPGDPGVLSNLLKATPLQRHGTPNDVANAVGFLLSSASDFVTGTVLRIDGGLFL